VKNITKANLLQTLLIFLEASFASKSTNVVKKKTNLLLLVLVLAKQAPLLCKAKGS